MGPLGWGFMGGDPGVPLDPRDRHLVETTWVRLEFGSGSKTDGTCKRVGGYARSVMNCILGQKIVPQGAFGQIKSADLRFGVLDHVVGEARGEVYLPPTPLRPGAGHRRATNSSAGFV